MTFVLRTHLRELGRAAILCALLLGCHREGRSLAPPVPAPTSSPAIAPAPSPTPQDSLPTIATSGPIALPAAWTACTRDADCVIAAIGCCSEVAVDRARAEDALRAIAASSRPRCAVKAACGAGIDGTNNGQPALCASGRCALPR